MIHRFAGFVLIDLGIVAVLATALVELSDEATLGLLVLGGALILSGIFELVLGWFLYPRAPKDAQLVKYGRSAMTSVVGVSDRGINAVGEQVARLSLYVEPLNERPFKARREVTLPDMPAIGERARVKFDPHRQRRLIVPGDCSLHDRDPKDARTPL